MFALPRLASHPFARSGTIPICAVSAVHVIQAAMVLISTTAANATPLFELVNLFHALYSPDGTHALATMMLTSAVLALVGALFQIGPARLILFIPQHFLLGVMALGGLAAAAQGSYLDGTIKPWQHILTDQIPVTALFVIHSFAILRRADEPNG